MLKLITLFIGSCLLFSLPVLAQSPPLTTTSAHLRTTFENLKLPHDENLGLLGGSVLFDTSDWLSVGASTYGALSGDRGGFITLGLSTELRKKLSGAGEANAGIFIGAGGGRGGYTLQGGGLMLRYHLGGQYRIKRVGSLGAGLSYIQFPNGHINSFQPYLSYDYPFSTLLTAGWFRDRLPDRTVQSSLPAADQEFSLVYRYYDIPNQVRTDDGRAQQGSLKLLGVEWDRDLNKALFLKIESAGEMGGAGNGYMQLLLGGGGRLRLTTSTALKLSAAAGFAGGGNVATGGGLLLDTSLALQQYLSARWFSEVAAGYVYAPDGDFKATSLSAKLGYRFCTPQVQGEAISPFQLAGFAAQKLRIRLTHQSYLKAANGWRNHHADQNVNLLGFQLDSFLNDFIYLTGQGLAAYQGQAGGYMTGLVGGGAELPLPGMPGSPLSLELEGLVGAAGGGGLDVAGGFVWQGNLGLNYQLTKVWSLIGSYGYMSAPKGNFRAKVLSLALAYKFSLFTTVERP